MKFIIFILVIVSLIIMPIFVFAECNQHGTTVIFINGMFTFSRSDAKKVEDKLKSLYSVYGKNSDVNFILGYNASHVGGLADILDVAQQAYAGGFLDYDLTNILRTTHDDSNTQKIILVGHSQGTFYTNAAYDYLAKDGGVDKNSISVYNVGTPANFVAGNGKYLTSSTDKVINYVRGATTLGDAKKPLVANVDLKLSASEEANPLGGHSFSDVYLAESPDRIIGDMDQEINNLSVNSDKSECFVQPPTGVAYWITDTGYYIADNVGEHPEYFATSPYTPSQMASIGDSLFQGIYNFGKEIVSDVAQVLNQNKQIGASLSSPLVQNNNQSPSDISTPISIPISTLVPNVPQVQFAGVQTAIAPVKTESVQDQLDDIQEKIDIIRQEVQALIAQQNSDIQLAEAQISQQQDDQNNDQDTDNKDKNKNNEDNAIIYPKILVSEVQIDPIGQRFVELYNPNATSVSLAGWYLQRKDKNDTSWGSFVSSANFQNKIIPAGGYFLISRELANSDILSNITLSNDNSLALKNPNGDISDKLGFGSASDPELSATLNPASGQSIGRKFLNGMEQDIGYNSADFELNTPTPKAQNIIYVAPPVPPGPEKILINEIQIAGTDAYQDFIELYNPNDADVYLKDYRLVKRAQTSADDTTIKSWAGDSVSKIPAKSYYLWVSSTDAGYPASVNADVSTSQNISSNNGVGLRYGAENTGQIIDAVGWGTFDNILLETAAASNPPAGQSIQRKWDSAANEPQDTGDNSADFESDTPTPRVQNIAYVAPITSTLSSIAITSPAAKLVYTVGDALDITGLAVTGTYSDGSTKIETIVPSDITGFDSAKPVVGETLTVTLGGKTTTYTIDVNAATSPTLPSITSYTFNGLAQNVSLNPYISETVNIVINASEPVKFNRIYICPNSAVTCDGSHDVKYFTQTASYNSTVSKIWNGKVSSGTYVPDGIYKISVEIIDAAGNGSVNALIPYTITVATIIPSIDATVTSVVYAVSPLASGAGTITNVPFVTSKADFEAALTKDEPHQVWDDSKVSDPVITGDTLTVTAQDGTTKATYTITVNVTNWAQGAIDSFTSGGSFIFNVNDFMPNQQNNCRYNIKYFRDIYPGKNNELGVGNGPCSNYYSPSYYTADMSTFKTPGEYDFYLSYCGGNNCTGNDPIGDYYRIYFDGSVWSALPIDNTKTRLSNDVIIASSNYYIVSALSATYTGGVFTSGAGTITNIRLGTSKADFETAFIPAIGATLDFSDVTDPVVTGNTLVATSQSGITKATYAITADTIAWSEGTINSYTPAGKFYLDTSFLTDHPSLSCNLHIYQSLYPFQTNAKSAGSFPCQANRPVYTLNMSPFSTVGDYAIWMSDPSTKLGKYYEMHFDGSNWSALSPTLSNDAIVTSTSYTVDSTVSTITNVPSGTSKADFEAALTKDEPHQVWDDTKISDPVVTSDTLVVTAQDGTTKATYTITVNVSP